MAEKKLRVVFLTRFERGTHGVYSHVDTGSLELYGAEPPDRDNLKDKSCIDAGTYKCSKGESPSKKGRDGKPLVCYRLDKVKGREGILIHSGNFAGDVDLGLKSDSEGCILLGNAIGEIAGQKALLGSRDAIARFEADLEGEDFLLVISWAAGVK